MFKTPPSWVVVSSIVAKPWNNSSIMVTLSPLGSSVKSPLLVGQEPLVLPRSFLVRISVKNVMLGDEDEIVDDAHVSQGELDGVPGDTAPVPLDVAVDTLLAHAEDSTREIEKDLDDTPALGALVAVVYDNLWRVLDQGHDQLDVTHSVDDVELDPVRYGVMTRGSSDNEIRQDNTDDASNRNSDNKSTGTIASASRESP